jgi:hypothetical protein
MYRCNIIKNIINFISQESHKSFRFNINNPNEFLILQIFVAYTYYFMYNISN